LFYYEGEEEVNAVAALTSANRADWAKVSVPAIVRIDVGPLTDLREFGLARGCVAA